MVSFECNAIYVEDVEDRSNIPKGCNAMYVKDVKDRSNTPKGCNAMYVKDVKDRSNTPKAVMLYMSKMLKMSKMGKEHIHTFWLITSLILNGFSIQKKFWKAET